MTTLAFIDTETTSLRHDRRIWDIALIIRNTDTGDQDEYQWFIDVQDLDMANADPFSLKVGRFYERHPEMRWDDPMQAIMAGDVAKSRSEYAVMEDIEQLTRGAHLVGAVVNFDAEVLSARMRAHGILPSWHYHLIDIEPLVLGHLRGLTRDHEGLPGVPWKSDDLTEALGVEPDPPEERHTALGDARWAMRIYDAVMNG